jgi:hypothetical protein
MTTMETTVAIRTMTTRGATDTMGTVATIMEKATMVNTVETPGAAATTATTTIREATDL